MKYCFLFVLNLVILYNGLAQKSNSVLVSIYQSIVPEGKFWKIEKGQPLLVEFEYFDKYSMCGASVQSSPGSIIIRSGGTPPFTVNLVYFTELKKAAFANNYTYYVTPIEDLYFYSGTILRVGTCLKNVQLMEFNITKADLEKKRIDELALKKKEEEKTKQEQDNAKRLKEENDKLRNEFLMERATKVYSLSKVNPEGVENINDRIKQITTDNFKNHKGETSFSSKYKLVYSSDTSGNRTIHLIKESGEDFDSLLIVQLKSIFITTPKLNGYAVATISEFPIEIDYKYMKIKFHKTWNKFSFSKIEPPKYVKDYIMPKYYGKDGTHKIKFFDREIMGKWFPEIIEYE